MRANKTLSVLAMLAATGIAGCGPRDVADPARSGQAPEGAGVAPVAPAGADAEATGSTAVADALVGRWLGPEGLFLDIKAGSAGRYTIDNRDTLDRRDTYVGRAVAGGIRFTRDGVERTIRAGTGADTGFKWLADKRDCAIVQQGSEGYCRDAGAAGKPA